MSGCIWLLLMIFFFMVFVDWQLLLMWAVMLLLYGGFYWWRSRSVDPVPKWEQGLAIVCSSLLTLMGFFGVVEIKDYYERKAEKIRIEERKKNLQQQAQYEIYAPAISPSDEVRHETSSSYGYDTEESYEEDYTEVLDFDAGYEDGYKDGRWRSPGFSKRSYDYDYEDGYAQGYYEAAHDEPDYREGEEYEW